MGEKYTDQFKQLLTEYSNFDTPYPLKVATLAQWILESGRGISELAEKHLNFGGLKYRDRVKDFATPIEYNACDGKGIYCKFASIDMFLKGYWQFIKSGPYTGWEEFSADPEGYLEHIFQCGYAADPKYLFKVKRNLEEANSLLGGAVDLEEPERPARASIGDWTPPLLEKQNGIAHIIRGTRPNGLEGLIVHTDAFRIKMKNNGPENSDTRTIRTLAIGQSNGLQYAGLSRTGRIFLPENFDWNEWGYHAGPSNCPLTARKSVHKYYVGIELNNPGLLYQVQEDNVFCPWFNFKRKDNSPLPILDGNGRAFRLSPKDESYDKDDVVWAEGGNIAPGWYLPITDEQFEALVNLIGYLAYEFAGIFSIDKVFGHDEVSPGRKVDPGGALVYDGSPMTMSEFRSYLKDRL